MTTREMLERAHQLDVTVYQAVAGTSTGKLDRHIAQFATASNYSAFSLAAAGVMTATGGPRGRRAAVSGLASLLVASTLVNLAAKTLVRRRRPEREEWGVPVDRHVPMPISASFPSGHSAAAWAFAAGASREWPAAGVPLSVLAGAVAYTRVHTGVHYPGDVLVGSVSGVVLARVTTNLLRQRFPQAGLSNG